MAATQGNHAAAPDGSTPTPKIIRTDGRRQVLASLCRLALFTTALFLLYLFAPLDSRPEGAFALRVIASLVVLVIVVSWQIIAVTRSPYPRLRAIEGVALSVPLFILLFASTYVAMSTLHSGSFTEPLARGDSVYFTVTVFATVGFRDIAPVSGAARSLITVQMLADLILIGVIAKVLLGAVQQRRQVLDRAAEEAATRTRSR